MMHLPHATHPSNRTEPDLAAEAFALSMTRRDQWRMTQAEREERRKRIAKLDADVDRSFAGAISFTRAMTARVWVKRRPCPVRRVRSRAPRRQAVRLVTPTKGADPPEPPAPGSPAYQQVGQ
jgi:hypothetical protein